MEVGDLHNIAVTDLAFRDPLTENTRRTRTHLLFISTLSILVEMYHLKLTKTPWLDIEIPSAAPHLLDGVLSAALMYLFFVFLLYAWQDYRKWRVAGDVGLIQGSYNLILESRNDLFTISQFKDRACESLTDPMRQGFLTALDAATKRLPIAQGRIEALYKDYRSLSVLQWFRLLIVEIGIPLVLGVVAIFHVGSSFVPFIHMAIP